MKRTFLHKIVGLVPLGITIAGCGAPTAETAAAPDNSQPPKVAAPAPGKEEKPSYRVVSEADPSMPADLQEALKKAVVPPPPEDMATPSAATVEITTSKGKITLELDGKAAPLHVKSFVYLAKAKFFDGDTIHRYEPNFVIQSGDPLSRDPRTRKYAGVGGPGYQIPREFNSLKHEKYVLAAARSSDPDSAGSQFYITLAATPFLDAGYTVFGKVVQGQDVVDKLARHDVLKTVEVTKETK